MMTLPRLPVVRFAVAVGASALAVGLEAAAWPVVFHVAYFLDLLAVVFTALVAGRGPGLLALGLTAVGAQFLFGGTHGPFGSPSAITSFVLFLVTGVAMVWLASWAQRARALAEEAAATAALLAQVGEILGSSLEFETTLQSVVGLAIPDHADYCRVDVVGEDERPHSVAVAHVDPAKQEALQKIPVDPADWHTIRRVYEGETLLVRDLSKVFDPATLPPRQREIYELAALRSLILLPLRAHGRILGTMTFAFTGPRRYDDRHRPLATELARRAAMAIDNARLYREARKAVQVREEFLSVASHELKTPLTSLRMQVQLLARAQRRSGEASLPAAELHTRVATIERQLDRLARLIDRLLDVTRIAAGRLHIEREDADLSELAREVAERFGGARNEGAAAIIVHADEPVSSHVDRFRVEQVLTNLLDNALKYGGGNPVEVGVARRGAIAVISVHDGGGGIPQALQPRVFQRFERLANAGSATGLGLGLYIAQQIVHAHGGTISLESSEGAGTTFTVELPVAA